MPLPPVTVAGGPLLENVATGADIDSGLIDFPSYLEDREIYLCWRLGEERIAGRQVRDIISDGLLVHRDKDVIILAPRDVAIFAEADCEPGGEALNIGGENVLACYRNAHPKQSTDKDCVCRLAACAVHRRHNDLEVVDDWLPAGGGRDRPWTGTTCRRAWRQ